MVKNSSRVHTQSALLQCPIRTQFVARAGTAESRVSGNTFGLLAHLLHFQLTQRCDDARQMKSHTARTKPHEWNQPPLHPKFYATRRDRRRLCNYGFFNESRIARCRFAGRQGGAPLFLVSMLSHGHGNYARNPLRHETEGGVIKESFTPSRRVRHGKCRVAATE